MKKLMIMSLITIAVLSMSCSKDDNSITIDSLSSTSWKCTQGSDWDPEQEYVLLVFSSNTSVEGWTKMFGEGEQKDWTGSYTISNNIVYISYSDGSFTGSIDGKTIKARIENEILVFKKQ